MGAGIRSDIDVHGAGSNITQLQGLLVGGDSYHDLYSVVYVYLLFETWTGT